MIEFQLPIKTVNPTNGSHGHPLADYRRRKSQSTTAHRLCPKFPLPAVVTLTRCSAGTLDEHDNLRSALKSVVDGIAAKQGIPDNDPRIEWRYAQEKCKRGTWAVRVCVEVRE